MTWILLAAAYFVATSPDTSPDPWPRVAVVCTLLVGSAFTYAFRKDD